MTACPQARAGRMFSSIRTMTVGPGIAPGLLTLPRIDTGFTNAYRRKALAGLRTNLGNWTAYRRWGISPRPENEREVAAKMSKINGGEAMETQFFAIHMQQTPGLHALG